LTFQKKETLVIALIFALTLFMKRYTVEGDNYITYYTYLDGSFVANVSTVMGKESSV